ncbi:hypothetical protein F5Y13DRAFT_168745 [Hypoxylon sp. FL1857]|nr:hypothetical protein F5Y13DRAFT_168745 [Hypoxylon sp. FL1857]
MKPVPLALEVFAAHRPELLAADIPKAPPATTAWPLALISRLWNLIPLLRASITRKPEISTVLFDTKYGLRVTRTERTEGSQAYSVKLIPSKTPTGTADEEGLHHYRIFPEWNTSFFWKDPAYFMNQEEDSVLEDEDIKARYPGLASYFVDWRNVYETRFERQGIHLGNGGEVFQDTKEYVAWSVEGLLMACWLTLQKDVATIKYSPGEKEYELNKDNLDGQLQEVLKDLEAMTKQGGAS